MDKFTLNVIDLLIAEPEYCTGHAHKSPKHLVEAFGILEDDELVGGIALFAAKINGNKPIDLVNFVLKRRPSWGEFLGAVLASLSTWRKKDVDAVMPQLMKTVAKAAREGVDH